jgi:hypothetical protein
MKRGQLAPKSANIDKCIDDYSKDLAELLPHNFKLKNENGISALS